MATTPSFLELTGGTPVQIDTGRAVLHGRLSIPRHASGLVIVANGDGDHVYDRGNLYVARQLAASGLATLTIDLLTADERTEDAESSALRFDQRLLASRLVRVARWARRTLGAEMKIGVFAGGLCAGAALAAASVTSDLRAVVCRGARVDLVVSRLPLVHADVLLLVGERDTAHLGASRGAYWLLPDSARLLVLRGAGHLLDEPEVLDQVAQESEEWFKQSLDAHHDSASWAAGAFA